MTTPKVSENHWPVLSRTELRWFTAVGGRFAAANEAVAVVARHLIERFDTEVEPITGPVLDDWSYANRPISGSATASNHASATAWDLNALHHPRGGKGTFTDMQTRAVQAILDDITDDAGRHVIRWGEQYEHALIDGMHFEITATPAQVQQARLRIEAAEMLITDITPEAARKIADALLARDAVPDEQDPGNKTWRVDSNLGRTKRNTDQTLALVKDLLAAQRSLAGTLAVIGDQLGAIAEALQMNVTPRPASADGD